MAGKEYAACVFEKRLKRKLFEIKRRKLFIEILKNFRPTFYQRVPT
jgi:hypothetical protein